MSLHFLSFGRRYSLSEAEIPEWNKKTCDNLADKKDAV